MREPFAAIKKKQHAAPSFDWNIGFTLLCPVTRSTSAQGRTQPAKPYLAAFCG